MSLALRRRGGRKKKKRRELVLAHITWFSQHRNAASKRGGGEGLRLQSQEGQDLCAAAAAEDLIFKTCTEDQTVDLTNKGMTKDSPRFSPGMGSVGGRRNGK